MPTPLEPLMRYRSKLCAKFYNRVEVTDSDEHSSLLPQGKGIGKAEAYRTGDPHETPLPALLTDSDQHSSLLRRETN